MKTLIIVAAIIALPTLCRCQDKLIGKSFNYINEILSSEKHPIIDSADTKQFNQRYVTYMMGSMDYQLTFYFLKNGSTCIAFKEILNKVLLFGALTNYNKDYIKINENNWLSKDNAYRVTLEITDDAAAFTHVKL